MWPILIIIALSVVFRGKEISYSYPVTEPVIKNIIARNLEVKEPVFISRIMEDVEIREIKANVMWINLKNQED